MIKRILSIFLLSIALLIPNISGATINWANNAMSLIADSGGITSGATSVTVTTGEGDKFPAVASPHYFMITFVDISGNREIVKVTTRTAGSNTMTIVRAQEGTSAQAFAEGSYVDQRITAGSLDVFSQTADHFGNYYTCDASAADQADTVNDKSLASLTGDIGTSLNATIVLPHSGTGSTTAYNVLQALDLSAYTNITFVFERGAILTYAANAIAFPASIQTGIYQIFNGTGNFTFPSLSEASPEWWGAARDGVTDDSVAIQAALDASSSPTVVLHSGIYVFDTRLDIPIHGKIIGAGFSKTLLRRKTGASGIAIYSDGPAAGIVLEGFTLDCDFAGTNGIDLGNSGSGSWGNRGMMRGIRVTDCAGIAYNLNVDDAYGYNLSTNNDVAGSPGTHQVKIAGAGFNCYGMEITGEAGTTAGLEFTGDNCNISGLTVDGELHLTKQIRFNGGDNNVISGLRITTEDNTKTYTQLIYFEAGSDSNTVRDIKIEKGATDTITYNVIDAGTNSLIDINVSFSVYLTANQSIPQGAAWTKVEYETEEFDGRDYYDAVTNYRFLPKYPGKYLLCAQVSWNIANMVANDTMFISIRKNGAEFKTNFAVNVNAATGEGNDIMAVVDANGTTDYFEIYVKQGGAIGAETLRGSAGQKYVYFQGFKQN